MEKQFEFKSKLKDFLKNKKSNGMYKVSIIRAFEEMFELYPNLSFGELLFYIQKCAGDTTSTAIWSDENMLKKVNYIARQLQESFNPETGLFDKDEPFDEAFLNERKGILPHVYRA